MTDSLITEYSPLTLRADLGQGRLPATRVLEIGLALTEALSHLHTNGLVHRDVKPSNVIFVNGRPKLADIGLVTDAGDTRSIVGTEGYLAPEGPGTPQADLFALGKVLYEAATGLDRRQFPQLPPDLRDWPDARLVFELNEIILKACATDPSQRYATAEAMLADLDRLQEGKSVRRAHQVERRWRVVRRGAGWLAVAAVVLTLIVLAGRVRTPPVNQAIEKRSADEVANGFYKLGRHYFEKNTGNDFETAAANFERAIGADPRFAQAYASLALTYSWSTDGWSDNCWKLLPKAKDPALKALELDDSLGDPHIALGWINVMLEWNWKVAEQEFRRATRSQSFRRHRIPFLCGVPKGDGANQRIAQGNDSGPRAGRRFSAYQPALYGPVNRGAPLRRSNQSIGPGNRDGTERSHTPTRVPYPRFVRAGKIR